MRKLILLGVVCLAGFLVILGLAGHGPDAKSAGRDYQPSGWVTVLGWLTSPFAPSVTLPQKTIPVPPAGSQTPQQVHVPFGSDDARVARFELAQAGAVQIDYQCQGSTATDCRQVACLTTLSAPPNLPQSCVAQKEKWRPCVSLRIHSGGGTLLFTNMMPAATVVRQPDGATTSGVPGCARH
jgi:hypothetical protein